jgi:TatD DNase family protein
MIGTKQILKEKTEEKQLTEMADAHSHLDLIADPNLIRDSISYGVRTIITNGVDTKSNIRSMEIADNKNVFAMLGIDPEHANVTKEELNFNIGLVRQNAKRISGIGEIGLDYGKVKDTVAADRQRMVFGAFLDLAKELDLPVSVHSRDAIEEVVQILSEKDMKSVHIHFFEGSSQQAREIGKKGWMISVPPLSSSKRSKIIKEIAIDNIMAESDSPIVGATPRDVEKSIRIVAEAKMIGFERAAELLTQNTKRFFRIRRDMLIRF